MRKTGAWLVRYALEQLGITHTFGMPGVHNTELYDEVSASDSIEPILVTHESAAAFMADAVSRTSDLVGTLLVVPGAGVALASAGIGEAYLAGVPMLVISGGTRTDLPYNFQLHEFNQQGFVEPITKAQFLITHHDQIVPTLYEAYQIALGGQPGPVFIEIPVNIQIFRAEVGNLPQLPEADLTNREVALEGIHQAIRLLSRARKPGILVGWGALESMRWIRRIAEWLNAPVATTLQGLSVFPATHPLHVGMGFGNYSVPAAELAFKDCDCLLAVGTRFAEIPTGSFAMEVPADLIHVDINPDVFHVNYPAAVTLQGDAEVITSQLWNSMQTRERPSNQNADIATLIREAKADYSDAWREHNSKGKVNPYHFFQQLRRFLRQSDYLVLDDGNHTYLAAELMPLTRPGQCISPTDFNSMGYAVPAAQGVALMHPESRVFAVVGDGGFAMTCMELLTARQRRLGVIVCVFSDGELGQIAQFQALPYNRKVCTRLPQMDVAGAARATGARFLAIEHNAHLEAVFAKAVKFAEAGEPVIVDVNIDYSRQTRFTRGVLETNMKRLNMATRARMIGRGIARRITR